MKKTKQEKLVKKVTKTVNTLEGKGFKFNTNTMKKVARLTNKSKLTAKEEKFLEQFSTQAKAFKKVKNYAFNPETILTKTAGKAITRAENKATKALESAGLDSAEASGILKLVKATTNPEAFVKEVTENVLEFVANAITESVGLGDLGGEIVSAIAKVNEATEAEATEATKAEATEEQPTEAEATEEQEAEATEEQEAEATEEQSTEAEEFGNIDLDYEQALISDLEEIKTIYFVYVKGGSKNGQEVPDTEEISETGGAVDVSSLSARGIDYVYANYELATEEEQRAYMQKHPYSIFSIKLQEATETIYSDDDQYIWERYENFIEWLQ